VLRWTAIDFFEKKNVLMIMKKHHYYRQ